MARHEARQKAKRLVGKPGEGTVWVSPVAHRITHINSIIINGNSTIINSVYYNYYV